MTPDLDPETALAMLSWQVDLGVTEAIGEVTVNRYEVVVKAAAEPKPVIAEVATPTIAAPDADGAVRVAKQLAAGAQDLIARGEVIVDAAGLDLGGRCDAAHRHLVRAVLLEESGGDLDQARSGLVGLGDPVVPGLLASHQMMIVSFPG